jgi:transposase
MDYTKVITEDLSYLQQQERQARQATVRDRIRYLRLLKSGQCLSQRAAGQLIGLGERQRQRLWQVYRQQGYAALVKSGYVHNFGKLSGWQISQLQHYLRQDQVSQLAGAQHYLAQAFGVHDSISGLCKLFQRLQVKLKTGRPVNIRHDAGQAQAFKKT